MADLRTWLEEVDKLGPTDNREDAHWDLELSTLTEIINERSKIRPAIVFDKIKGYPDGYRVAVNLLSSLQRLALTMGMDPGISEFDFVQQWRSQVKTIEPIEPRKVKSAPLFENVQKGGDIDLSNFPCRVGMSSTAAVISAPTIWSSPAILKRIGSMSAPTGL